MNARLPLAIREKYGLVHVPSRHRVDRWCRRVRQLAADGLPPEHAGMQAAHEVFPYEARRRPTAGASRVTDLVALCAGDDTLKA